MIEERKALPESVGDLFDTAFAAYGRRFGLYASVTLLAFAVQDAGAALLLAFKVHGVGADVSIQALNTVVDAFILGVVAIGAIADVTGTDANAPSILASAWERWPSLIGVNALVWLIMDVSSPFTSDLGLGGFFLLALPVATLWATIALAPVACAVDASIPVGLRIFGSFAQSFRLALSPPNFGRTVLLGVVTLVPALLQEVLGDQLGSRHVPGVSFWANIPVDAIVVGPLQAVYAVFYVDFIRRLKAAEANR